MPLIILKAISKNPSFLRRWESRSLFSLGSHLRRNDAPEEVHLGDESKVIRGAPKSIKACIGHNSQRLVKSILAFILMASVPISILLHAHFRDGGLQSLIMFGEAFSSAQLPQVRDINPPTNTQVGYDGQFYAQIALDPLLQSGELGQALDNPSYRARRIALPALASILGGGVPEWTLNIFALLNFVFWAVLAVVLIKTRPPEGWRDIALLAAILWTSGTLTSLSRALTDLPAAAIGIIALLIQFRTSTASWLFGCAALFKETSILSSGAVLFGGTRSFRDMTPMVLAALFLPIVMWIVYVQMSFPGSITAGSGNFALPFVGLLGKFSDVLGAFSEVTTKTSINQHIFLSLELLAPAALCFQLFYFVLRPRRSNPIWLFGIGFALLMLVLGESVWADQFAYTRVLLPMTFAFNLLLHAHARGAQFWGWFAFGNLGLVGSLGLALLHLTPYRTMPLLGSVEFFW